MKFRFSSILFIALFLSCKKDAVIDPPTPPIPSEAPKSLSSSQITSKGFQLSWTYSGTDSVQILIARDSLFTLPVADINGKKLKDTKFSVTGLNSESVYFCQVKNSTGLISNLIKVTTEPCYLTAITDSVTNFKSTEFTYNETGGLIKMVTFSNNQPFVTTDFTLTSNGNISSWKETDRVGLTFLYTVQGSTITGVGRSSSVTAYDSVKIELTPAGLRKRVIRNVAFPTGSDTLFRTDDQVYSYDGSGQLSKIEQIEFFQRRGTQPFAIKETLYDGFVYDKGNLLRFDLSEKNATTSIFEKTMTVEYEYDLNRIHPKTLFMDNTPPLIVFLVRQNPFLPVIPNSKNLVTKITNTIVNPNASFGIFTKMEKKFNYTFGADNSVFPKGMSFTSTAIRRSNGQIEDQGGSVTTYTTLCK